MKIILLNGPPRSGKDTTFEIINAMWTKWTEDIPYHEKFSRPIKEAFAAVTQTRLDGFVNHEWEHRKEQVIPTFGVSYRRWQIDFSEKFMKPLYGRDIFARLMVDRLKKLHPDSIVVISDCGFQNEYNVLRHHLHHARIFLFRLIRTGTSFDGDSRETVFTHGRGAFDSECNLLNDGTIQDLRDLLLPILSEHMRPQNALG